MTFRTQEQPKKVYGFDYSNVNVGKCKQVAKPIDQNILRKEEYKSRFYEESVNTLTSDFH